VLGFGTADPLKTRKAAQSIVVRAPDFHFGATIDDGRAKTGPPNLFFFKIASQCQPLFNNFKFIVSSTHTLCSVLLHTVLLHEYGTDCLFKGLICLADLIP
jgi:hypothetical protein